MSLDAVVIDGVRKVFGRHVAVDDLSLRIPAGSLYGFIGPNGSGKTTTLRMILRIIPADAGSISVLGKEGRRVSDERVAYLPEERGLYRKMRVREQLIYFGRLKGLSGAEARSEAESWLRRLDLVQWGGQKTEALSKGMTQKVQFISAVIGRPRLVILDEPFSGLDPVNAEVLREAVQELRKTGTTVIFSTHDMAMAEKLCDCLVMIYRGKKVLDGAVSAIRRQYGSDTILLDVENPEAFLRVRPSGVEILRETPHGFELRAPPDSQDLLRRAMAVTTVTRFEVVHPTLHDIFVRIARPVAADATTPAEA
ncbi:MAG: ATP-binding cassette domain-containing protein [Opitutales bacterium]|nr:ATP-binding cassette domain-containing protein [Opitutales bacterium]